MRSWKAALTLSIAFAGFLATRPATAQTTYPYCMIGIKSMECTFSSLAQCQAAAAGGLGTCQSNPAFTESGQAAPRRR
jgi:hypothetical protein